jgi:MFS family permease
LALVTPLSLLLKRNPQEIGLLPDGADFSASEAVPRRFGMSADHLSPGQAMRTRSFWLMLIIFLIYASYLLTILTHLVPHITDLGFSATEAASVLSVAGGATIVGRVFLGTVSDRTGKKGAVMLGAALHIIALLCLLWARELWTFYVFALIFGFGWGGMGPATAALIGDTFGLGRLGAILGLLDVGFNIGAAIGPVVAGLIYDLKQTYFLSFLLGIGLILVTMVLVYFVRQETGRATESR